MRWPRRAWPSTSAPTHAERRQILPSVPFRPDQRGKALSKDKTLQPTVSTARAEAFSVFFASPERTASLHARACCGFLDCAEQVAVRAGARETEQATELVLGRSRCMGQPIRIATNRQYLERALRFEFETILFTAPESPIVCKSPNLIYLWQPLASETALQPNAKTLRVNSSSSRLNGTPTRRNSKVAAESTNGVEKKAHRERPGPAAKGHAGEKTALPTGIAGLVAEAECLQAILGEAKSKARQLVAALRRHRRCSKRVAGTLATLRQIPFQEVAS